MNETYLNLNIARRISLILLLAPVFIGQYIQQQFGLSSLIFLVVILIPFYFISFKSLLSQIRAFLNIKPFRVLILYLAYCTFTLVFTRDFSSGLGIIIIITLGIIIGIFFSKYRIIEIYKYVAWTGLIYSVVLYLGIPKLFFNYYTESERFAYYHGDIQINPNYFSIFIIFLAIYFLFDLIMKRKRIIGLLSGLIPLLIILFLLIETQSRSGLFTFIIVFLLTMLFRRSYYTIIGIPFILASLFLLVLVSVNYGFESRLMDIDLNNRDGNWKVAIDKSLENIYNFTFGYGIGSAEYVIGENENLHVSISEDGRSRANAHSMYIENLLNLGFVGLILLLTFFISILAFLFRNFENRKSYLPILISYIILVSGLVGNQMRTYPFVIIFAITIAFTIQKFKADRCTEDEIIR